MAIDNLRPLRAVVDHLYRAELLTTLLCNKN